MVALIKLAYFIVLLGGLVFFHELGHFIAAKLCNVKVLKFSLGFGPRIWGFKRGETEYQIAALPLGGYVRMLGEDPTVELAPEDRKRGFATQKPHRRAFIASAGPLMNLLLPPIVLFGLALTPQLQDPPVVALVLPNEPADRAGVEPRDRIISVDGVPTRSFEEMRENIEAHAGQPVDIVVLRNGQQKSLHLTPTAETERSPIETTQKGKIGIMSGKPPSYVGVVPGSRAAQAGLQTFDRVIGVNGQKLATLVDLDDAVKKAGEHSAVTFQVMRSKTVDLKTSSISTGDILTINVPAGDGPLGLDSPDLYVREVSPDLPAALAGLKPLDKIVSIDGTPVFSVMRFQAISDTAFDRQTKNKEKHALTIQVDRAGQRLTLSFAVNDVTRKDPLLGPITEPDVGFRFHPGIYVQEPFSPSERVLVSYTPAQAMSRALRQTYTMTRGMLLGIGAIFTGRVSTANIGGPIMLYQLSSTYSEQGLTAFLTLFVLISINLGLMNLLPVPVLDGFHIVLAAVEGISRRAVSLRVREVANYVGLAMLLALMGLAFKNDIWRQLGW
jgi:regulator of sigma E protease